MIPDRLKSRYQSKKQFLEGLKAFIFLILISLVRHLYDNF